MSTREQRLTTAEPSGIRAGESDAAGWKSKYRSCVAEIDGLERTRRADREHLGKALVRLTRIVDGLTPPDISLDDLRDAVTKDEPAEEIARRVFERANTLLGEAAERVQSPREATAKALTQLVDEVRARHPCNEVDLLVDQVRDWTDSSRLPDVLRQLAGLLRQAAIQSPVDSTSSAFGAIHDGLSVILATLPGNGAVRAEHASLVRLISACWSVEELPCLFEKAAAFVSRAFSTMEQERSAVETFLSQVTDRLSEIDGHFRLAEKLDDNHEQARGEMELGVENQLTGIARALGDSKDLARTQIDIQRHLDRLRRHLDQFRDLDTEQKQAEQSERTHLINRIRKLESETGALRQEIEKARTQSERDPLTEILNRRGFDNVLAREISRRDRHGSPFAIVLADADHFKVINDTYGHPVGDQVLQSIAKLLHGSMRAGDYVARIGGEEFAVLLPLTELEHALAIGEKVRERISRAKFNLNGNRVAVSISCGVGESGAAEPAGALLARVDAALYAAKTAGRNCCKVAPIGVETP